LYYITSVTRTTDIEDDSSAHAVLKSTDDWLSLKLQIFYLTPRNRVVLNTFTAIVDLSRSNFSIARAPLFQLKSAT